MICDSQISSDGRPCREGVWEAPRTARVRTVALDDYVRSIGIDPEAIAVIKLDVEGSEMQALEGMTDTLERASAAVFVELQPWRVELGGRSAEQLVELMRECGYTPWSPRRDERGGVDLVAGAEPDVGEDVVFLPR